MALAALIAVLEPLFSSEWHRVAGLRPRLRRHAAIHRHVYRSQVWFVLHDPASSRLHRFTPQAHAVIGLMDGRRTVQAIWEAVTETLGDDAPTQDQVIELLGRLHRADLLETQVRPDADEAQRRQQAAGRARLGQRLRNPLALRIPLLDPNRALGHLQPLARLLFNPFAAVAWLLLVLAGLAVAGVHADALVAHATDRALSGQNLLLAALVFPLVKLLHELGHALAVKRWGGAVHETGVMLLVFAPLPYVDATGSAAFASKYRRIAVSAAGIAVELALAAVAVMLWVHLQPGLARDIAFNVMLIGGVSTLLFNGNPLLRFDGYYVLADLIEIPNLAQRAQRYLGYLLLRRVFGVAHTRSPVAAPGEAPWFLFYGIASGLYRIVVAVTIIGFVAGRFFTAGLVLAAIAAVQMLLLPLAKQLVFLLRNPLLERRRLRAVSLAAGATAALTALVLLAPAPLATVGEGVVWLPADARVRSAGDGFVRETRVRNGAAVSTGQVLFEIEDPLLAANIAVLEARLGELRVRRTVESFRDRVKASILDEQIATVSAELDGERARAAGLAVTSPGDGVIVFADDDDPVGRYVRQGEALASVVNHDALTVRAVVEQDDIALLRERLRSVDVRFADRPAEVIAARLVREVPAAQFRLPSPVLGTRGGGRIAVDAGDEQGLEVARKVFQVELALPPAAATAAVGQRVHVRFDHGTEPLARQWQRRLSQLFLNGIGA